VEPTKKWQHENLVTFSKQLSLKHSFFAQLKWNAIKTSLDGWNPSPSQSICRKKMDPPWKPLWLWLTFRHGKIHHESQHRLTEILGDDQSRLRLLQGFSILWVKTIEKNRGKNKRDTQITQWLWGCLNRLLLPNCLMVYGHVHGSEFKNKPTNIEKKTTVQNHLSQWVILLYWLSKASPPQWLRQKNTYINI